MDLTRIRGKKNREKIRWNRKCGKLITMVKLNKKKKTMVQRELRQKNFQEEK